MDDLTSLFWLKERDMVKEKEQEFECYIFITKIGTQPSPQNSSELCEFNSDKE